MIIKNCLVCSKEFRIQEAWERRAPMKYCSKKCFHQTLKGKYPKWLKTIEHKMGKDHPLWKGDNATYESIHIWLKRWFKKDKCEKCSSTEKLEWANKSGQYLRKRSDFIVLCRKCHRRYDKKNPKSQLNNSRLIFDKFFPNQKYPKQRLTPLS